MSLLWRDRHIAVLAPNRVTLVRRRRGWSGRFDLKLDAPWQGEPAAAADALASLLQHPDIGRGELLLLLSNHFVRYLLIPWRSEMSTPEEFATYAGICCNQTYGEDASRHLHVAPDQAGRPRLAAVMDGALLSALTKAASTSRLRLVSIQPYLTAAFNRLRTSLPRDNFFFVLAEPARHCVLSASHGHWHSVRAGAGAGEDRPELLSDLIERESRLLDLPDDKHPPIFVHAPGQARLQLPACQGVAPQTLGLPIPASLASAADPLLTMAMTVA